MSTEVYTFGVVPSTLATWIGGFTATTATRPTFDEVEAIIYDEAGQWCAMLVQLMVSAQTFSTDTGSVCYTQSRVYIGARAAARVLRAKDRTNMDLATALDARADKVFEMLQKNPALFGAARNTSVEAPGLTYVSPITNPLVLPGYINNGTVAQRSAVVNRM